jgi:hypothetical protein
MTYPDRVSASTSVPYSQTTRMSTAVRFESVPLWHRVSITKPCQRLCSLAGTQKGASFAQAKQNARFVSGIASVQRQQCVHTRPRTDAKKCGVARLLAKEVPFQSEKFIAGEISLLTPVNDRSLLLVYMRKVLMFLLVGSLIRTCQSKF